jgi:hypothetical protein
MTDPTAHEARALAISLRHTTDGACGPLEADILALCRDVERVALEREHERLRKLYRKTNAATLVRALKPAAQEEVKRG